MHEMKKQTPVSKDCFSEAITTGISFFEHSEVVQFAKAASESPPEVYSRPAGSISRKRKFTQKESSNFFELFELLERLPLQSICDATHSTTPKQTKCEGVLEPTLDNPSTRLTECFSLSRQIGVPPEKQVALSQEHFNTVWKAAFISSGKIFAVKFLPGPSREHLTSQKRRCIRSEIEIHRKMKHPYIARLCGFIKNIPTIPNACAKACALVIEYSPFGSLHDQLFTARMHFPETTVSRIIGQLCSALRYMHTTHHTVHCDVKLANILYSSSERLIKLIDFGFAVDLQQAVIKTSDSFAEQQQLRRGTLNYLSPEQIRGTVDHRNLSKVDVWAVGMCAYELICGTSAFENTSENLTRQKILTGRFSFTALHDRASKTALSFIDACFAVDPRKRPSIDALMKHPWLNQQISQDT